MTPALIARALVEADAHVPADHHFALLGTYDESGAEVVAVVTKGSHWRFEVGVAVDRGLHWHAGVMYSR
jgi:hypothetical protein